MATGPQKDIEDGLYPNKDVEFASVDLNATGTTDVYDPSDDAEVYGVFLRTPGGTAVANLEITDGSNTATLVDNRGSAGADIEFGDTIALSSAEKLQVNVTTKEGSSSTGTAAVSRGEKP